MNYSIIDLANGKTPFGEFKKRKEKKKGDKKKSCSNCREPRKVILKCGSMIVGELCNDCALKFSEETETKFVDN